MSKILNFFKRNLKEVLREPLIYIFCLGFPLVMLILFQVINKYTGGQTPMFELRSLLPAIIMFSYSFVMLTMSLLVSKDRQTFFLKRLYSSPMRNYHFILGYALVGLVVGVFQALISLLSGLIIALISGSAYLSILQILLLVLTQIPMLVMNVFIGILFGTLFNDKSAPGVCSIVISLCGVLGGCWMPLESMGGFETFCRFLPFYPSVYLGRVAAGASNLFNQIYTFDGVARLGLLPVILFATLSVVLSFIIFKTSMTSDK